MFIVAVAELLVAWHLEDPGTWPVSPAGLVAPLLVRTDPGLRFLFAAVELFFGNHPKGTTAGQFAALVQVRPEVSYWQMLREQQTALYLAAVAVLVRQTSEEHWPERPE